MTLNHQALRQAAAMAFSAEVKRAFGEEGEVCFRRLLDSIHLFFREVPPEGAPPTFVFLYQVLGDADTGIDGPTEGIAVSVGVEHLAGYRQRISDTVVIVVRVRGDGLYDLAASEEAPSLEGLSTVSLVFVNEGGVDRFVIGGKSMTLPTLAPGARSNFAVPTVAELDDALERYRQVAAFASCPTLAEVWEEGVDGPRLVFRNKPEATMRESLQWFLSVRVDGASVRPEHNTDESKPVDLVVDWFSSKERALIEIKWLGHSLTKDSDGTEFTSYGRARAAEGADQLADYLDRERRSEPGVSLRGYLAVFDGRRRSVIDASTPIAEADACHYRTKDIALPRQHSSSDGAITALIRYFLEPRASHFAVPAQLGNVLKDSG